MPKSMFENLREIIDKENIVQRDLAYTKIDENGKKFSITEGEISSYVNGKRRMRPAKAKLLAEKINLILGTEKYIASDFYFEEEQKEYRKARTLLERMQKKFMKDEFKNEFNECQVQLNKILKECYFSNELYINYELGHLFFEKGDLRNATRHYEENLSFYIDENNYDEIDLIARRIAYFYNQIDQSSKGPLLYEKLKPIIEKLEHKDLIKFNNYISYARLGQVKKASKLINEIEFSEKQIKKYEIDVLLARAYCIYLQGDVENAEEALKKLEKSDNIQWVKWAEVNRAELYFLTDQKEKIEPLYEKVKKYALIDELDEAKIIDYRTKLLKINDLSKISAYLEDKETLEKTLLKSLEINLEQLSFIEERISIIKNYLKKADKNDIVMVDKIIKYLLDNKKAFKISNFIYEISNYLLKNNYVDRAKKFYIDIEKIKTKEGAN